METIVEDIFARVGACFAFGRRVAASGSEFGPGIETSEVGLRHLVF